MRVIDAFGSLSYFVWAGLLCLPAMVLGLREKSLRGYTLFASLAALALICVENLAVGLWLIGFVAYAFTLAGAHFWFLSRVGQGHGWEKMVAIILAIAPLVFGKTPAGHSFAVLGISYLTFRLVQHLIETSDGIIRRFAPIDFLSFLLFFPTLTSGPIDRSRRFDADNSHIWPADQYQQLIATGAGRIVIGVAYKFIGAAVCAGILAKFPGNFWLNLYLYSGQLFFDFAGYSLMAVGLASFFGIRVPMNFRYPFAATSIKDFWNRWHITLSFWLRDYVFLRLVKALVKTGRVGTVTAGRIGFVVNMTLMGAWHGLTLPYLLYGGYHGVLLVAQDVYEKHSPWPDKYGQATWYRILSLVVTFHLVCFGFLIFSGKLVK